MAFLGGLTTLVSTSPTLVAVGAGVLAGAVAGTAVVASGVLSSPPPEQLALVACPGDDRVVARVTSGQSMLVTARSGDGAWLQLYIGEPGLDKAWGPASAMRISESVDALPVAGCEVALASPTAPKPTPTPQVTAEITLAPGVTASPPPPPTPTPFPTPTPKPTPTLKPGQTPGPTPSPAPTPTPTPLPPPPTIPPTPSPTLVPTPVPDLTPPSITNVSITGAYYDGAGNYYIDNAGNACGTPSSATINATVTDAGGSGLAGYTVTLRWKDPFGTQYNQQMSYNLTTHLYNKTITNNNAWPGNSYIEYWITAADNAGNSTTTAHPPDNQHWLFKGLCIL